LNYLFSVQAESVELLSDSPHSLFRIIFLDGEVLPPYGIENISAAYYMGSFLDEEFQNKTVFRPEIFSASVSGNNVAALRIEFPFLKTIDCVRLILLR